MKEFITVIVVATLLVPIVLIDFTGDKHLLQLIALAFLLLWQNRSYKLSLCKQFGKDAIGL